MKAIILAAGEGKRLRPLTYGIPKPLLPVGGRPVIDYVIDNVRKIKEIDTVYVAVSHNKDTLQSYLSHTSYSGLSIETVTTLGWETGGDLKTVLLEKEIRDEPVLVCYGDNVTSLDTSELLSTHKKNKESSCTISLFEVPKEDVSRFGIAELSGSRITRFVEKPSPDSTSSRLANAGYFVLEPSAVSGIPMRKFKIESDYFPSWATAGRLFGHVHNVKFWMDIGTLDSYRAANKFVEGILPPPKVKQ